MVHVSVCVAFVGVDHTSLQKTEFGNFVSSLRKEKGITQKELARQLFVSDKAVSKWETGQSIPDVALLIPLAEILGVTVAELLECHRMEKRYTKPINMQKSPIFAPMYHRPRSRASYRERRR